MPTMATNCDLSTTSVTTDDSYRQHDSPSSVSKTSPSGSRRRTVNRLPPHVDPCLLAPLRKRRIDENVLPPSEREKLLMKRCKNRDAAAKCRIKKKANVERLKEVSLCVTSTVAMARLLYETLPVVDRIALTMLPASFSRSMLSSAGETRQWRRTSGTWLGRRKSWRRSSVNTTARRKFRHNCM